MNLCLQICCLYQVFYYKYLVQILHPNSCPTEYIYITHTGNNNCTTQEHGSNVELSNIQILHGMHVPLLAQPSIQGNSQANLAGQRSKFQVNRSRPWVLFNAGIHNIKTNGRKQRETHASADPRKCVKTLELLWSGNLYKLECQKFQKAFSI